MSTATLWNTEFRRSTVTFALRRSRNALPPFTFVGFVDSHKWQAQKPRRQTMKMAVHPRSPTILQTSGTFPNSYHIPVAPIGTPSDVQELICLSGGVMVI